MTSHDASPFVGKNVHSTVQGFIDRLSTLLNGTIATSNNGTILPLQEGMALGVRMIMETANRMGKVILIGNGGSAAIVSHAQNDLSKAAGVRALVFQDAPLMTALSNDIGYEFAYERPVRQWANKGDVLIVVSSSGRSPSVVKAAEAGLELGMQVIALSGFHSGNPLRGIANLNLYVASSEYGEVEVSHMTLMHYMTDSVAVARRAAGQLGV